MCFRARFSSLFLKTCFIPRCAVCRTKESSQINDLNARLFSLNKSRHTFPSKLRFRRVLKQQTTILSLMTGLELPRTFVDHYIAEYGHGCDSAEADFRSSKK